MISKILILMMLMLPMALADNPDERASMEIDLTKHFTNYDRSYFAGNSSPAEKDRAGPLNVNAKVILPSRENLSLIIGMGYIHEKKRLLDIANKQTGFYLKVGLKIYLPE